MKRFLRFSTIGLGLILPLMFLSCEKDDDDNGSGSGTHSGTVSFTFDGEPLNFDITHVEIPHDGECDGTVNDNCYVLANATSTNSDYNISIVFGVTATGTYDCTEPAKLILTMIDAAASQSMFAAAQASDHCLLNVSSVNGYSPSNRSVGKFEASFAGKFRDHEITDGEISISGN
ncbi:MAG: hypothetical protein JJU02_07585 [Cryomorphaceae bacterium]|nr:hypothetical protein [Cryomorphaceae bacterium]